MVEFNSFEANLVIAQLKDEEIVEILSQLEKTEERSCEMGNGVVYRKAGDNLLFYVPSGMEKNILFRYHDDVGHIGTEKVSDTVVKND